MTKQNYLFLFMLSLAVHSHLHAAQMNVEVKEQAEKTELTAQEQAAAREMFEIIKATNKDNAAQQAQALQKLLQRYPRIVDAKNNHGWTPLVLAAYYGNAEIVKLLIAAGAQIDAQDNIGWTPLMYATRKGHAAMIYLLIAADANKYIQNNAGETALDIAIKKRFADQYQAAVAAGEKERRKVLQDALNPHVIPDVAKIVTGYAV